MYGVHDFDLYVGTCMLLNLTPGQDTFYILGRSMAQGRSAGMASVLGISSGALVHSLAAALGLSAVVAASATAFTVIKFAGAAYLIWLGIRMLLSPKQDNALVSQAPPAASFGKVYRQGLLTNVLNPKVALFFLAFVPQFIAKDSGNPFAAFIVLGLTFVTTGTIWCFFLALFAASLGRHLRERPGFGTWLNRTAGALFVLLGLRLATSK